MTELNGPLPLFFLARLLRKFYPKVNSLLNYIVTLSLFLQAAGSLLNFPPRGREDGSKPQSAAFVRGHPRSVNMKSTGRPGGQQMTHYFSFSSCGGQPLLF